jgi:hypothetical protein
MHKPDKHEYRNFSSGPTGGVEPGFETPDGGRLFITAKKIELPPLFPMLNMLEAEVGPVWFGTEPGAL